MYYIRQPHIQASRVASNLSRGAFSSPLNSLFPFPCEPRRVTTPPPGTNPARFTQPCWDPPDSGGPASGVGAVHSQTAAAAGGAGEAADKAGAVRAPIKSPFLVL